MAGKTFNIAGTVVFSHGELRARRKTQGEMDKRIKNIIFDFGGIIVDLDKEAAVRAFEALGFDAGTYIGDYAQDGVFALMETGEMSPDEFCGYVRERTGLDVENGEVFRAWNKMLAGMPPHRLRFIRRLRTDYRTFLLSNTNAIHWEHSRREPAAPWEAWPEDCFDRVFLSFRMHAAKPDARIFREALSEAGLKAEETFYIDDSSANCEVAESLGMRAFHSRQPDDWFGLFD